MIALVRPVLIALAGGFGVAVARDNLTAGPAIVAAAAAVGLLCVLGRERGAALAALGVGAAGAFAAPDGVGPLLVVGGVVVGCRPAAVDGRLVPWRDVLDAAVALPGLAGLAGTVAAQPSARGIVLGGAVAATVFLTAWRGTRPPAIPELPLVAGFGLLGALAVAVAPDRLPLLGDLPSASVQASRSAAAGLGVFALVLLAGAVQRERTVAPAGTARHRR